MPIINGTPAADTLNGTADADIISGLGGDDIIDGLDGDDVIEGGEGNDTLYGGNGIDTLSYANATSRIIVSLITAAAQNTGGAGIDSVRYFENIVGSAFNDELSGDTGANVLDGGDGDDLLTGRGGGDSFIGGAGIDTASFEFTNDTLVVDLSTGTGTLGGVALTFDSIENVTGGFGSSLLIGDAGDNYLSGGRGNATFIGGAGNDRFDGTFGTSDVADYSGSTGPIVVDMGWGGSGSVSGPDGLDYIYRVESVIGTAFDDVMTGGTTYSGDELHGGGGNDILGGSFYSDRYDLLDGGDGIDTVTFAAQQTAVSVDLTYTGVQGPRDRLVSIENLIGSAFNDWLRGDDGVNVIEGADGNDDLGGRGGDDMLVGGLGNDMLEGGAGDDLLIGGDGLDLASYATSASGVNVNLQDGSVHVTPLGTDTFDSIEGLLGSAFADILTGDAGNNQVLGGDGNDVLNGGAGDDRLDGGYGVDTASYADAAAGVRLTLVGQSAQNTLGAGTDTLIKIENLIGSAFADTLTGNELGNALNGGDGDDTLNGGLGNDVLNGGDGIDTATYANATSAVRVSLAITTAQSTLAAGTDTLAGIENLTGSAYDDQLTGDAGDNVLTGNAGNDTLLGGLGNDTLNGGAGIDTTSYANAASAVTVNLALTTAQNTGGGGIDTFLSIENLTGSAYDDVLTGSAQANAINGGVGNDVIDGGSGNDVIDGGNGNDTIKGSAGDDVLNGGGGNDVIAGGGGAGADTITGGNGLDTFVYTLLTESAPATADRIADLLSSDRVDVSAIDANATLGGNQAFHFAAAFTGTAGELVLSYDAGTDTTTAAFDTNGDSIANMVILFTGDVTALTGAWTL